MKKLALASAAALFLLFLAFFPLFEPGAARAQQPDPKKDLEIRDYSWKSHGVGRMATLAKITIANSGETGYERIRVRIDLLTEDGRFKGSLHGTASGEVPAGGERTFRDLDLGLMNSELEVSEARVTGARASGPSPASAENVIFVKNWEFEGATFGTEGFITEITLENTGKTHFKNIRMLLTEKDGGSAQGKAHFSSVVIHDILPAGSEKTFSGINVGFSSPDAVERSIAVAGAEAISAKELNYILSGGGSIGERIKKKVSSVSILRKKPGTGDETPSSGETGGVGEAGAGTPPAEAGAGETGEKKPREIFPQHDIVIREFEWGTGIAGSVGTLSKLIIENISDVTYEKIEFEIEFFKSGNTPVGSNRFKVREPLAPGRTMSLRNVQVGFLNKHPDPNFIRLKVVKAKAAM